MGVLGRLDVFGGIEVIWFLVSFVLGLLVGCFAGFVTGSRAGFVAALKSM